MFSSPPLSEIRRLRKRLGITQQELAEKSNTSQSLVARIESETVDPRYSNVSRIFAALTEFQGKGITARDLMTTRVIGVERDDLLKDAALKLETEGLSQMPVFHKGKIVGAFSEKTIHDKISAGDEPKKMLTLKVIDSMDDPFPTVGLDTQLGVISTLLEYNKAVTVTDRSEVKGIITNADLLKVLHT
ncbi:MAG: CBS domain-containing protein [Candidatus Altiarchaeota archaeon]